MSTRDPLEVVRAYLLALNRNDVPAAVECLAEDCVSEAFHPDALDADADVDRGLASVGTTLDSFVEMFEGGLEGGLHFGIRTIGVVESGWIHVEWVERERRRASGEVLDFAGYTHFLVQDGLIRRQRTVRHAHSLDPGTVPGGAPRVSSRSYPSRPVVGVGAVVLVEGKVLLVKRRFEPLAGQWSLPGGSLEVGETLESGVAREILEETGLEVAVGPVVEVFDRILMDEDRRVRYHFVLIDYLCRPVGGRLAADSDVAEVALVDPAGLPSYRLTPKATAVIERAVAMDRESNG